MESAKPPQHINVNAHNPRTLVEITVVHGSQEDVERPEVRLALVPWPGCGAGDARRQVNGHAAGVVYVVIVVVILVWVRREGGGGADSGDGARPGGSKMASDWRGDEERTVAGAEGDGQSCGVVSGGSKEDGGLYGLSSGGGGADGGSGDG